MSLSTPYSPQIRITELLEREKTQTTDLKIFRDNAQIVPTGGLYTLLKPDGVKVVDGAAALISGSGTLSYSHSAAQLVNTLPLGEGYVQEWTAVISGESFVFRRMAALVRRRLYPVVSDGDLSAIYSDLESLRPSTMTSYQSYIDDSWYTILRRLRTVGGGYEYLVMSSDSFFESHRHLTLYLIFRDFHSSLSQSNGRFLDLANLHFSQYQEEFNSINFVYDTNDDGIAGNADKRTRMKGTIYLTRNGPYRRWFRR